MRLPPARQLSDRAVNCSRVFGLASCLVYGSAVAMVSLPFAWAEPAPTVAIVVVDTAIALLLVLFFIVIRPPIYARIWRYELLDNELYLQSGIFTQRRLSIPLIRVQNVDTWQGPVGRLFSVSSVQVSTAGGMAEIPMLDDDVALELRERINAHVRARRAAAEDVPNAG